jgi:hypothetical protein
VLPGKFVRHLDFALNHLAVNGLSGEKSDQEIRALNFLRDAVRPSRTHGHRLIYKDSVLCAERLVDL